MTLVAVAVLAALGTVGVGWLYYAGQRTAIDAQKDSELGAVRDLKIAQIVDWKQGLLSDGHLMADDPTVTDELDAWLAGPHAQAARAETALRGWLDAFVQSKGYVSAGIVSSDGGHWIGSSGTDLPQAADFGEALSALASNEVTVTDLYLDETGAPRFDVVAPLRSDVPPARAAIVLHRDPARVIYPLIQSWPTPSPSSETLLVRRSGDQVLYLNDLRFRRNAALRMTRPLTDSTLLAAQALSGGRRTLTGVDYRGVPVIGAVAPIPGTDWFIIAKVDQSEAFAAIGASEVLALSGVALVLALIGLGVGLAWRQRTAMLYRERAEAEARDSAALLAAETRLAEMLASIRDAFVALDPEYRYTYLNDQAVESLGQSRDELIGHTVWEAFPDARGTVFETEFRRVMDTREPAAFEGYYAGLERWNDVRVYPAPDGGITLFFVDVSERKRAEQALEQRTDELARSNAELERFAYVASHDLQEPLRMVASYTQLLQKRYKGRLDTDADDFIGFAVDGANRMQALIHDLLAYSRVGTQGSAFEPADLNEVLASTLRALHAAIEDVHGEVTHDVLPTVTCDAMQVGQLFQNLISNALKFHGDAPPRVHVGVERSDGETVFSVTDNGIGIDAAYFDRIFVIFQRLLPRSEYPGTGIGLAICKRIVERHGGKIWVESTTGFGSTFRFTLGER